jgi:pimeloyl-ACP methyl ester carboxylesterase
MLRLGALAAGAALLAGCASPAARHDALAADAQLSRELRIGAGYEHVCYTRQAPPGGTLHMYFDGDGTPWLQGRWPAADPTPRVPLTLQLVARDPHGAYLGRPCYLGAGGEQPCSAALWTDARYGEAVVRSMTSALRALLAARRPERVVLVGYSGGGTLAMLVAERVPQVAAVVTIAANLDVGAWAQRHGYRPLSASLDPARRAPLPRAVRQIHLVGGDDANVPPALVRSAAAQQPGSRVIEIAHYDNRCCWTEAWPGLLYQALGQAPAAP